MAITYQLIASNTLGSSAASVTFSSIPNTYTDLVLRTSIRGDRSASFDTQFTRFNSDTATNYSNTYLASNGASVSSNRSSADDKFRDAIINAATSSSNTFSNGELYIANYTSTSSRAASYFSVQEDNSTTAYIRLQAYLYRGTSALATILLYPENSTNFVSGSSFFLYGIKNS